MIITLTPVEPDLFKSQIVNIMFNICDAMLGCRRRKDQQLHAAASIPSSLLGLHPRSLSLVFFCVFVFDAKHNRSPGDQQATLIILHMCLSSISQL